MKTFTINGVNFNAESVLTKSESDFISEYKIKYKDHPFFGRRDEAKQETLLKEVYQTATDTMKPKEPKADNDKGSLPTAPEPVADLIEGPAPIKKK